MEIQPVTQRAYQIRCTADQLILDGQTLDYRHQILHRDKFYIMKTNPKSSLKTPIIINRNNKIDQLDRRIFSKKYTFEIIKSLQRCSLDDAIFIIKRVPKFSKYFAPIIQGVTLPRWKQLLQNNEFFIEFYQSIESIISKKSMSSLRKTMLEQLTNSKLKRPFQRLFYMLDNLVLEDESLRNCILNLNRDIVLQVVEERNFFEKILLNNWKQKNPQNMSDSQNSGKEDNLSISSIETIPEDKEMTFPQKFLINSINVIKSCQRLRIKKQIISKHILNNRFFRILKIFFKALFEKQRIFLLQILAYASQFEPQLMWKITFQEGRTTKCKNLKFLELLLTSSMIDYSDNLGKIQRNKEKNHKLSTKSYQSRQKVSTSKPIQKSTYKKPQMIPQTNFESWEYSSLILQKFLTFQSPERKTFCNIILNSLLSCKLIGEELEYILIFLQSSAQDEVYFKKNIQIWKMVVSKIQNLLIQLKQKNSHINENKKVRIKGSRRGNDKHEIQSDMQTSGTNQIQEEQSYTNISNKALHKNKNKLILPLKKPIIITLLKIYKILVINEGKFGLDLNKSCFDYLLSMTENRKGLIEGVRLTLIEIIHKEESIDRKYSSLEENTGESDL